MKLAASDCSGQTHRLEGGCVIKGCSPFNCLLPTAYCLLSTVSGVRRSISMSDSAKRARL
jgi:hypothetical protein